MIMIYTLSTIAFDSLILLFCVLFNGIPGKWYRWHTVQLQLLLSVISLLFGTNGLILSKSNEKLLIDRNSLFATSLQSVLTILYLIVFIASVYRYIEFRKTKAELPNKYFMFCQGDYKIVNELNYTLGNLIFIPNIKAYAVYGTTTIIFSGRHPSEEIDAGFICKKIGDNVYECLSYIDLEKQTFVKRVIQRILNVLMIVTVLCAPILVAYTDYVFMLEKNVDNLYSLYEFVVLFLLGSLGCNLFGKTKGFGKALYCLFIIMIMISMYYLLIFFR